MRGHGGCLLRRGSFGRFSGISLPRDDRMSGTKDALAEGWPAAVVLACRPLATNGWPVTVGLVGR